MNGIFFVYLVLMFFSLVEISNVNKNIKYFLWLLSSLLIIFVLGFGYKVGVDWVGYKDNYILTDDIDSFEVLYNYSVKILSPHISFWFFAIVIKVANIVLLLMVFKRYSKLPILAATVFFALAYPFINDVLRQLLASIVLLSAFCLYKKYPNAIFIILSSGFHSSAILLLTGKIRILNIRSKKNIFIMIATALLVAVILGVLISVALPYLLNGSASEKIEFYSSSSTIANVYSSVTRIGMYCLALYFQRKVASDSNDAEDYIYRSTLLLLLIEIASLGLPILAQRFRLYLLPFVLIALTNGIYKVINSKKVLMIILVLTYVSISLHRFLHGTFEMHYQLKMNILVQYFLGFPPNNWESDAYNYWIYRD
ncbi:EpsG family protein [Psychrobacter immobilis]|uniref:EpsG family protein n=1 Tax=Psychrobacter immobilis TaxID=498 RepID=UPI001918BE44|nr:EpsG family protein [Psychrobacter immobilis]